MAGIEDVLERLVTEPTFRDELHADPATALAGYVLDDDDLVVLAATLDRSEGGHHDVEQRTSKSAFTAMLGTLSGGTGDLRSGGGADLTQAPRSTAPTPGIEGTDVSTGC